VIAAPRPLVAFVGPSISQTEAAALCPGLDLRPPVRRDDLYREREKGAWGFLIIDGVFMQEDAVSPREVADVLEDGALVVGASSMGALRAADCWPAGALGVGLIYRLYRRGVLGSDEEVAVAVSTDGSDAAVSVPLVNVRYAVSRAVRRRLLDRATARQIVAAAASIYYPERTWRAVLQRVEPLPAAVLDYCAQLDLKRDDARRALSHVEQMVRDAPALAARHERRRDVAFSRSEMTRERGYDATDGIDPERLRPLLVKWLIGSGRLARYLPASSWPTPDGDFEAFALMTWQHLEEAHQLDAELMRLQAVTRAARAAASAALAPRAGDVRRARMEIAGNHGARSWRRLLRSSSGRRYAPHIVDAGERLARAKRMRAAWFSPSGVAGGHNGTRRPLIDGWQRMIALLARHLTRA